MIKLFISIVIILLGYIHNQCVSSTTPQTSDDCVKNSDESNYCCMISSPGYQSAQKKCMQLAKNNFYGQNRYSIDGETWNLNCGADAKPNVVNEGQCGNSDPVYSVDCWASSNLHNSCCYYLSANTTGIPACQWYEEKHSGNILSTKSNIMLSCSANYTNVSYSILILLALAILVTI